MKMKYLISVFLLLFVMCLFSSIINAQSYFDDKNYSVGDFQVTTKFDTANYTTHVVVKQDGNVVYDDIAEYMVDTVVVIDLNNTGEKTIFVSQYSGGAHCCFQLLGGTLSNYKYTPTDTLFLGNVYFQFKDLNYDHHYEIETAFDGISYAFTNYAETRFPTMVYKWENNKFIDVTKDYPALVNLDIKEYTEQLKDFLLQNKNFCPKNADEDTFNTPAGSLKTILAAIAISYSFIGENEKAIETLKTFYTCPDKDKFISTFEKDYKIK
jgi:hypothetical protein